MHQQMHKDGEGGIAILARSNKNLFLVLMAGKEARFLFPPGSNEMAPSLPLLDQCQRELAETES